MPTRLPCLAALALAGLLLATASSVGAKGGFRPGDLRLCSERACVAIGDQKLLDGLARFSFHRPEPVAVHAPRIGAPYLQLENRDGNVIGLAATARLDRFRSRFGTPQFASEDWYRLPAGVARGLRVLAAGLAPLRATASTVGPTRYG